MGMIRSRQTRTKRGGIALEVKRPQKKTLASTFVSYVYEIMRRKRETNR
jgi:hypothetical protein